MFPDKKSLITGIILCGFGFASLIFGLISTKLANPDNLDLDDPKLAEQLLTQLPFMIHLLCGIWAVLSIIGMIMLFPAPDLKPNDCQEYSEFDDVNP